METSRSLHCSEMLATGGGGGGEIPEEKFNPTPALYPNAKPDAPHPSSPTPVALSTSLVSVMSRAAVARPTGSAMPDTIAAARILEVGVQIYTLGSIPRTTEVGLEDGILKGVVVCQC